MMERRAFLTSAAAAVLVGCTGGPDAAVRSEQQDSATTTGGNDSATSVTTEAPVVVEPLAAPEVDLPLDAFALGVASGDPDHESVVLWTRLLGELPASVELLWEMAYDETFTSLAATGTVSVADGFAHTAHQIVAGFRRRPNSSTGSAARA